MLTTATSGGVTMTVTGVGGDIISNSAIERIVNSNHSTNIALEPTLYERIAHKIAATPSLTSMLRKRNVSNNAYERIQNAIFKTDVVTDVLEKGHNTAASTNATPQLSYNLTVAHDEAAAAAASAASPGVADNSTTSDNNLAATITSIRSNVTRVLNIYFQNTTDEHGYGAATTTTTTRVPTAATPAIILPAPTATATDKSITSASNVSTTINNITTTIVENTSNALSNLNSTITTLLTTTEVPTTANANYTTATTTIASGNANGALLTTAPSITYPTYSLTIRNSQNCADLFANYTQPQDGLFCNWTWDEFLCWPPTPAGVLARMHCPEGWHGIDTTKFANRKCELDGHWGGRPNETYSPHGWTDYQPCYKPEVNELMQQMKQLDTFLDIAKRTRYLEIVGLVLSLLALILSLIIFYNFRSLRNNRTKIHKNLFFAMVLQVVVRLTIYVDQAIRRGKQTTGTTTSYTGIENTPYLCESLYVLLEYARTAMFMWMFIEGLYLHMVTVAFFQGRFPFRLFTSIGWGIPLIMTNIWAGCTAAFTNSQNDCWWNYNLTPYYWILEGPRLIVILLNFFFLINIIRVLVVKLRQSQASEIEQTRKAVRAAIVLLPLLGITNLLHLVPDLNTPWKFAVWSYGTHFLTSFQGFFIALIYCFLNGEVRAVILKSIAVYMSVRGHPEWVPKRASMYSAAYNTAPETEAQIPQDGSRYDSPPNKRNGRKPSTSTVVMPVQLDTRTMQFTTTKSKANSSKTTRLDISPTNPSERQTEQHNNYNNNNSNLIDTTTTTTTTTPAANTNKNHHRHRIGSSARGRSRSNWMVTLCFRGQKVLRVPPTSSIPPESVVFELSEQ